MRLTYWTVKKSGDGIEMIVGQDPEVELFDVVMKSSYDLLDRNWREKTKLLQKDTEKLKAALEARDEKIRELEKYVNGDILSHESAAFKEIREERDQLKLDLEAAENLLETGDDLIDHAITAAMSDFDAQDWRDKYQEYLQKRGKNG